FLSCKKINEATELGSDLIPPVDNVNTFEVPLDALTNNLIYNDTTALSFFDEVAVGHLNDPEFGTTHANGYFDISRGSYGTYPFIAKHDSISVDSVILSMSYTSGYGDTSDAAQLSFRVFEIAQTSSPSGFNDTSFYKFSGTPDFPTTGGELGSKTFSFKSIRDTHYIVRTDTAKAVRVLRIPLSNSLGERFKNYDSTNAYLSDSAFKTNFRGFAIKADNIGSSLAYFDYSNNLNTKLVIYYKAKINGKDSSSSTEFYHLAVVPPILVKNPANYRNGQADVITRNYSGNAGSTLNNGLDNDDKVYIQSGPGTYASLKLPGLDALSNKVIHRAEVVATRIMGAGDNIFSPPIRLVLDRINKTGDTAFLLDKDLVPSSSGTLGFDLFGGTLKSDQTYRFNITRYVQGIITRHESNDTLRIYAPLRTTIYSPAVKQKITVPVLDRIAEGRVILAGGNYFDPKYRLRLRIIYSNL
ncbi:MAG: DUF4270 family protein, partial [Flavisolibacter sp.]